MLQSITYRDFRRRFFAGIPARVSVIRSAMFATKDHKLVHKHVEHDGYQRDLGIPPEYFIIDYIVDTLISNSNKEERLAIRYRCVEINLDGNYYYWTLNIRDLYKAIVERIKNG